MWESLGFRESPFNTNPLKPKKDDVDLLVGRNAEAVDFCTQLGSSTEGVLIISGRPGVGKTSFFNIQQYLLENQLALFGPKILAARTLCPVQPSDDIRKIAIRALDSLFRSVSELCQINGVSLPSQTTEIGKWIAGTGTSGFSLGINILGCGGTIGRTTQLPKLADATFEAIADAIAAISSEVVETLGFKSSLIALDNIENLSDDLLGSMLISFRDTLFSITGVWWILIGQSGLSSLIQSLDPRVFERTTGSGVEIKPIELEELYEAIKIRVSRFHKKKAGKAPLTQETFKKLFEASFGEVRFVFKYSNTICAKFVEKMRSSALQKFDDKGNIDKKLFEKFLNELLGQYLIKSQISEESANGYLREIVLSELNGLALTNNEIHVLNKIGELGKARAKDWKEFSIRSMQDFSSNYLTKLHKQKLLTRSQEGRAVNYSLRGIALLSHKYGLLVATK